MSKTIAIQLTETDKLRYTNYAIIDNKPGFWIQHSSTGFVCGIPYEAGKDIVRAKALEMAQKICQALEDFDNNTSKN